MIVRQSECRAQTSLWIVGALQLRAVAAGHEHHWWRSGYLRQARLLGSNRRQRTRNRGVYEKSRSLTRRSRHLRVNFRWVTSGIFFFYSRPRLYLAFKLWRLKVYLFDSNFLSSWLTFAKN